MASEGKAEEAPPREAEELHRQLEELRIELEDARETLRAIREGEVDALVVETPLGERIFTLEGADHAYRELVEQMQEGAVTLTEDGSISYCNRRFAEMIRLPMETVVGSPIRDYVVAGDQGRLEELIYRVRRKRQARGEVSLRTGSGRHTPAYLGLSIVDVNSVRSICLVVTDLAEQKRTEKLLASERHSRAILNQTLDAIVVFDSHGRLTFANAAARKLAQMEPSSTDLGFNSGIWGKRYRPEGRLIDTEETWLARALRGETTLGREVRMVRSDGSHYDILINASPLRDVEGHTIGAVGAFADITQRKRMEEELQQAKQTAESANRAKSQFLANMSHELRTPMSAVLGMTDLALTEPISPTVRDYLSTARESAGFLLELLDQVLDFSRIEAGRFELESAPFRLRRTLDQLVRALGIRAHEKGLELICDVHSDVPDAVVGDCLRLRQVLINLIGNAVKFTSKGEIVVRVGAQTPAIEGGLAGSDLLDGPAAKKTPGGAGQDKVTLVFSVSDTGIGIPREHQERIFAPFTQGDASTTRHYGGSGLGLAISSSLVGLMGGAMAVESEMGKGSTFRFTVQLRLESEAAEPEPAGDWSSLRGLRVLVVSDNPTSRRILEHLLNGWSMNPETATDVPDALAKLHQGVAAGRAFRLVLTEAGLPGIDGYTLAEWLQSQPNLAERVILMVSATERRARHDECRKVGASCIEKPISQSDLLNTVAKAMGVPAATRDAPQDESVRKPPSRVLRILVAEDTPANQKVAIHVLSKRGHHVTVAQNGQEALERLEREDVDVVLMDVQMPILDGFQATAAVRKLPGAKSQVPIIAMTAHALKGDAERCLAAGMNAYLAKPLIAGEMIEAVERWSGEDAGSRPETAAGPAEKQHEGADRRESEVAESGAGRQPGAAVREAFNLTDAVKQCFGKHRLFQDMVECYFQESPELLEKMQQSLLAGQAEEASQLVHRLKNTVGYLGAVPAMDATRRLERLAREGQVEAAREALRELAAACQTLGKALESHRPPKAS